MEYLVTYVEADETDDGKFELRWSGISKLEAIVIIDPVPGSAVTSPVHVVGEADPTFEQALVVQVTDANGSVIATAPATIQSDVGQRGPFVVEVAFTVTEEQPGRVSVYTVSARDGGVTHLSSVEVTLRP